ncbi:MAG: ATP-binding protein [Xenococcaceae cyanobacterium MO_188.B29]|nr:ATP-binding protein [Xenococcaceae cyanobacterium MO_188.B29]
MERKTIQDLQGKSNPFASTRVDNPFQTHVDLNSIYQGQFNFLKTLITEIKNDFNHQTKGVVIIGDPGTGKTHLIMRLAKELLKVNRLVFIRQPNNSDAVIYHIYSRILESLVEKVPENNYTQLENLLANSFCKILNRIAKRKNIQKEIYILESIQDNNLNIYTSLGSEGTQKKRDYWNYIERITIEWWLDRYGGAGYAKQIIKGIIKYCSYSDVNYKKLVTMWLAADELHPSELHKIGLDNWHEEISKEAFSLEAISVLSKLSLLDEPIIIAFDQLEGLGLTYNRQLLLSFGEAIKEIFTHVPNSLIILNLFPDRWQQFQEIFDNSIIDRISQHQIYLEKPNQLELKQILQLKAQTANVNVETLFTPDELAEILSGDSIRTVLNKAAAYYRYKVNGIPLPRPISPIPPTQEEEILQRLDDLETKFNQFKYFFNSIEDAFNTLNLEVDDISNPSKNSVIIYLDKQKQIIENNYNKLQIISDSDDVGKVKIIAEAFANFKDINIEHLRLGTKRIPEQILINHKHQKFSIGFLQTDGTSFTSRIKNYNELVIHCKDINFLLWRDVRRPLIMGRVGKEEREKLNNIPNGKFQIMNKENRINFELIYQLVIDLNSKDLDIPLVQALKIAKERFQSYWLIKILTGSI